MDANEELVQQLKRYLQGSLPEEERSALFAWLSEGHAGGWAGILEQVRPEWIPEEKPGRERVDEILRAVLLAGSLYHEPPVVKMHRLRRWVVAASVLLAVGMGIWFYYKSNTAPERGIVQQQLHDVPAPGVNRAMITLADGRQVFLDSAGNGQLAQQGNMKLMKLADGHIAYQYEEVSTPSHPEGAGGAAYNTLTNPRGSKVIDMTLSDGSRVWLNAGSSITYPVAFAGNERKVSMTGEAYFEIVPLSLGRPARTDGSGGGPRGAAKMPFIVQKGDMQVTVLGTHFNVNAYDDESDIKVTLLEGRVKVSRAAESVMLTPGQQAILPSPAGEGPDHYREGVRRADLEQVMAWKNGFFSFGRAGIQAVMKELARWYDVEVVYEGDPPAMEFGGELQRSLNLSQVLRALEKSKVHFRIEDKKIIVLK